MSATPVVGVGSRSDEISAALSQASPPETTRRPRRCDRHLRQRRQRRHHDERHTPVVGVGSRSDEISAALSRASPREMTGRPRRCDRQLSPASATTPVVDVGSRGDEMSAAPFCGRRQLGDEKTSTAGFTGVRQQRRQDERDTFDTVGGRSEKTSAATFCQRRPPETTRRQSERGRHFHQRRHQR